MNRHAIAGNIGQSIAAGSHSVIVYRKTSGIRETRTIYPSSIERCKNRETIVRAFCPHRGEPRNFRLDRIEYADHGASHGR